MIALAHALTGLITPLHRRILPKLGIRIGEHE